MNKAEMIKRIYALENKVVWLQEQIYRLREKPTPTNVNPYDLNKTRIR